jgi:hypothetical protein
VDTALGDFRELVLRLRDEASAGWGAEELAPWIEQRPEVVAEVHRLGLAESAQIPLDDEVGWGLYALGRLVDIVISPAQPHNDDPELLNWTTGKPWWAGPAPAASAWEALRIGLRCTDVAEDQFHPFFHEIVAVETADDPDETVSLTAEHWAGAFVGTLLLVRAGVTVRAGRNVLVPETAARSCLYWSWWRRNRVVRDCSHGWGRNSQWGTDARRDYLVGDELHYNVDGRMGPRASEASLDELTQAERDDLVRYRHSIQADLGSDPFPFDDHLVEPRPFRQSRDWNAG